MTRIQFSVRLFLLAAAGALGACQTYDISPKADNTLQYVQQEIALGRNAMTSTTSALKTVRDADSAGLRPAMDAYKQSLTKLDEKAGGVGIILNTTEVGANKYFTNWQKSIDDIADDDLRAQTMDRKAETMSRFNDVHDRIEKLRGEFRPFMSKLQDIQTALAADPTISGRNAAAGTIRDVMSQQDGILRDIDDLNHSIDRLRGK